MQRFSNLIRVLLLILIFSASAVPSHADGVNNPIHSVSGVMVFTGNDTCLSAPCSEAIAFSFDLGYQFENFGYYAFVTNVSEIWTGDIGSFAHTYPAGYNVGSPVAIPPGECSGDVNFISFTNAGGDDAEVSLCQNGEPTPVVPSLSDPDLFRCSTSVCISEFPNVGPLSGGGVLEDVTVKQLAEPATFTYLALGLLSLVLFRLRSRKFL